MKTERVTLLTSPDFKAFLHAEAKSERVSVGELVRSRCERRPNDDERLLIALTAELRAAVVDARQTVDDAVADAAATLRELRAARPNAMDARPPEAGTPDVRAADIRAPARKTAARLAK